MHASRDSISFLWTCSTFVFFFKIATHQSLCLNLSCLFYLPLGTSHFCFPVRRIQ
jgi:hypothetical protein